MEFNFIANIMVFAADLFKEIFVFKDIFSYKFFFSRKRGIIAGILVSCMFVLSSISCLTKYISVIYIPVILGVLMIFLKEKEKRSAAYFFASYICICQVDVLLSSLLKMIIPISLTRNQGRILTASVSAGMVYLLCRICRCFQIKIKDRRLNIFMIVQVVILCLVVVLMGVVSNVVEINSDIFYGKVLIMVTSALCIMISILGFVVYSVIQANRNYHELEKMNEKYLEMQSKYYENIQRQNREIRKFKHDIQGHFICLNHFIGKNEIKKAKEYIKDMDYDLDRAKMEYDVGYEVASVILNDKKEDLEKNNIKMKIEGTLPSSMSITNYDFCSIFSNLLNNAIEACQIVDGTRYINIVLGSYSKYISLKIVNSCTGKVILETRKSDTDNHGFGISRIKECVKRYGGDIKIEKENEIFTVDIIMKFL